jgi:AcrR family transcriptional regulator
MTESPARDRARNPPGEGIRLRGEIVGAAERLLATSKTPATLTLRGIAAEAGITAPAIYPHFRGIDEILAAVVETRFLALSAALGAAVAGLPGGVGPLHVLRAKCLAYCRFGLGNPGHYAALFASGDAHLGVPYENSAGERSFDDLRETVAAALGQVATATRDADEAAALVWAAMHGLVVLRNSLTGFPWPDLESQVDLLVDAVVGRS